MFSVPEGLWALILGGSSGFGLASAHALAELGLNLFIVHRDRRSTLKEATIEFEKIRSTGIKIITYNENALDPISQTNIIEDINKHLQAHRGKIRLMLHSIAMGSLKPLTEATSTSRDPLKSLANMLSIDSVELKKAVETLKQENMPEWHLFSEDQQFASTLNEEDLNITIQSMGTSIYTWAKKLQQQNLFHGDSRIVGLTSEGNQKALPGYGAVSCAKAVLESLNRSMAVEFGPKGIKSNIIQAGCTLTPSFKKIPNHEKLAAQAKLRNPLGRLTTTQDIAEVVAFLATDQAKWLNGSILTVDGGEKICG